MKKRLMAVLLCVCMMAVLFTPYASVLTDRGALRVGVAGAEDSTPTETPTEQGEEPEEATEEPAEPAEEPVEEPEEPVEEPEEPVEEPEEPVEEPEKEPEEPVEEPAETTEATEETTAVPEVTEEPAEEPVEEPAEEPEDDALLPDVSLPRFEYPSIFDMTMPKALDQVIEVIRHYVEDGYSSVSSCAVGVASVSVPENGKVTLTGGSGQWQVKVDDVWANIAGETGSSLTVTGAFVRGLGSSVTIRSASGAETTVTLTGAVDVPSEVVDTKTIEGAPAEEIPEAVKKLLALWQGVRRAPAASATYSGDNAANETETVSVVIKYVFVNGDEAASPWTATIAKGSNYSQTVTSPTVVGYAPDKASVEVNVDNIQADMTYTVTYSPAEVTYTVKHYQQNADNDNYTLVSTDTKTGFTENAVGASLANTYPGFTALLYDTTTKIAADGSTVVEIYYDRNYYLMTIDLDGGYGAEPVYGRYGAKSDIDEPKKPGYTFAGWTPAVPATIPVNGGHYKATWRAAGVTYLVQYWLENANDDGYSYDSSTQKHAMAGTMVSGSDDKTYTGFVFDHADKNVVVNGDETSIVNVYYKRKTYTLTFKVYEEGSSWWESGSWKIKAEFKGVKYGEDTTKYWNQAPEGYRWCVSQNDTTAYTYAPAMPNENLTVYGQSVSNKYKYTIHYYEEGTTNRIKEDNVYYRSSSGYLLTEEDYILIPGFTCLNTGKTEANKNLEYTIYYRRNSYQLDFNNKGTVVKSETVPYEKALSGYNFTPEYPAAFEEGAYKFAGWYTDPGFVNAVDWATAKMPYNNTVLYAKWVPVTHTVTTRLTKETAVPTEGDAVQVVAHGATATEPAEPTNGEYKFVGWFYYDEEYGEEKAFLFTMPVNRNLDLYAKWSSNTLVNYTIYYKLEDDTVIAPPTTGTALANATKTFDAKTGDDLNEGYRKGYFPQVGSHSITMSIDGKNEFTFVYVQKDKVPYTVRYLEVGTEKELATTKTEETPDAVITETFVRVSGYAPDAYQKRLVLSANAEENVLIFWYSEDDKHAPVQIIHWTQNIAGDGYTEYQSSTDVNGKIGETYTEAQLTLPGFTYNEKKSNASGELTEAGLVLNLYYDRIEYPYEFKFLEQGTNKSLEDSVTGSARYQAQVTQTALDIPGYTLVSDESQAINIAIEDPADVANNNVRIFYYTENTVTINYVAVGPEGDENFGSVSPTSEDVKVLTGTPTGSTPTAGATYRFDGWYKDEACTLPVESTWVDDTNKLTPQKQGEVKDDQGKVTTAGMYVGATYYAKFVRNTTTVTVKKLVTGNFGDKTKEFEFHAYWYGDEKKPFNFSLKDGNTFDITEVPIGTELHIKETDNDLSGYVTTVTVVNGERSRVLTPDSNNNGYYVLVVQEGDVIVFTNQKDMTPDTGVILDSLPYVLILAVVALGAAGAVVRSRRRREDD